MEKKLPEHLAEAEKIFPQPAPLRLMFQSEKLLAGHPDEARFGRISDTRYCWCPKLLRPLVKVMVAQEYTYAYAAASPHDGVLDTLILPSVNGECMRMFIDEVASRHANENVLMVVDGAGWHRNESLIMVSAPPTPIYSAKPDVGKVAACKFHGNNLSISSAVWAAGRCSSAWRSHV